MWVNNNNLYKFYTVTVVVGHHYPTVIVNVYRVNFLAEAKILFCNKQLMMYELFQKNKLIHSQYYYSLQRYKKHYRSCPFNEHTTPTQDSKFVFLLVQYSNNFIASNLEALTK